MIKSNITKAPPDRRTKAFWAGIFCAAIGAAGGAIVGFSLADTNGAFLRRLKR